MADPAEDVLQAFISSENWRLAGKKASPEHQLRAWFVWTRAEQLKGSLSGGALTDRVRKEHDKVVAYIKTKLGPGPKYDSGPLVPVRSGAPPDGPPAHLDLLDLARRRTDDPVNLTDKTNPRVRLILARAREFTTDRVRRVLQIVWRAAALEADVVLADTAAATLDVGAMDEILNRRLRIVERMALNVSSHEEMLGLDDGVAISDDRWEFDLDGKKDWFDRLRVRLFEYPYAPPYAPISAVDIAAKIWADHTNSTGGGFFEHDARMKGTRVIAGGSTSPISAGSGARFATRDAAHWEASGGDDRRFRIDFVPKKPSLPGGQPAAAIDSLFEFSGSGPDGRPIRADFWNRGWLWCEQVISALCLEALLFGRRRRLASQPGRADTEFGALADRLPILDLPASSPPARVVTRFLALDQHIDRRIPGNDPFDNGLMMSSLTADTTSVSFDPHFRNRAVTKQEIQVGDWVRANNAAIYYHVGRGGAWGAENAIITDVQPVVKKGDRGRIETEDFRLQGHGTRTSSYNGLLDFMAAVMRRATDKLWEVIVRDHATAGFNLIVLSPSEGATPTTPLTALNHLIMRWTPYAELNTIKFPRLVRGVRTIPSGPWWFVLNIGLFHSTTAEEMLAKYPKTVGGSRTNANAVSKLPGITNVATVSSPQGQFGIDPAAFWENHVLFPMFEPAIFADRLQRDAWQPYFRRKKSGAAVKTTLVPTPLDHRMVPGIFRRGPTSDVLSVQPKVARTT